MQEIGKRRFEESEQRLKVGIFEEKRGIYRRKLKLRWPNDGLGSSKIKHSCAIFGFAEAPAPPFFGMNTL
jgi:hypothetical protein